MSRMLNFSVNGALKTLRFVFFHHVVLIDLCLCFVVLLIFRSFFSRSIMLFYGVNCFHIDLQLLMSLLLMEVNLKVVI